MRTAPANINVCETLTYLYKQVIFDLMVLKCDERGLMFLSGYYYKRVGLDCNKIRIRLRLLASGGWLFVICYWLFGRIRDGAGKQKAEVRYSILDARY
ncbi:MAG: hypothetical protein JYX80_03615 [Candidatus Scalindua sediminis]|nr:hypothetical protein [Candidatus Scalindua sediminis]HDY69254.1 hypothetical protein [Candidatus Scalindua sp.]